MWSHMKHAGWEAAKAGAHAGVKSFFGDDLNEDMMFGLKLARRGVGMLMHHDDLNEDAIFGLKIAKHAVGMFMHHDEMDEDDLSFWSSMKHAGWSAAKAGAKAGAHSFFHGDDMEEDLGFHLFGHSSSSDNEED